MSEAEVIEYIESFEKSIPICYVAMHFDLEWQQAKDLLERLYWRELIGKLVPSGRYCRLGYARQCR